MKEALTSSPTLMPHSFNKPFNLYTSTTHYYLEGIPTHNDKKGKDKVIYFINQNLIGYKLNYPIIKKMCLAIVFSTKKLRQHLLNVHTNIMTRLDPLLYILS